MTTPQTMSFKSALHSAESVQMWVHTEGTGYRIDVAKAAVRRSDFYDDAPVARLDGGLDLRADWDAFDDDGRLVWSFNGSLLQIG